ncbi:hypothetical protein BG015_007525 [Linnemannia schmuckeri]|uniref:N-acetyltransferase domain-containing protein n=1 Tax=Linnemannia schmuckeri TaxID=64567 RepID=A0A9P5RYQ2_9FUNG|nr:hypothetical protein BG015_007525 [Linnemannia schmuckeri]
MLTNLGYTINNQSERIITPLPMSAVYNKPQFVSQFISLHRDSTQPTLVTQLLTTALPNVFAEYWILYDDNNRPVACAGANTVMSDISVGYVSLFEAKNERAGTIVLKAAIEWLKRGGVRQFEPVRQILGPVNLTTWLQYRLRVDTDEAPSMSFEPRHPEFYQACFAQAGFVKAADYYSTFFHIDSIIDGYTNYTHGETLDHIHLAMQFWNTLDFASSLSPERHPYLTPQDNVAKRIYDLTIELFRGKELFDEGFTRQNHRQIVLNDMISRPQVDNASLLDLSSFIVDPQNGEDVGYMACWVENNDTLVLKTVGFVPRVRKSKVFAFALLETMKRARDVWGCTKVVCALMNENSASISERVGGKSVRHVYRLYIHHPASTVVHSEQSQQQQQTQAVGVHTLPEVSLKSTKSSSNSRTAHPASASSPSSRNADSLQQRQQDIRLQMYWDQQRQNVLAQRSRGRVMAHL